MLKLFIGLLLGITITFGAIFLFSDKTSQTAFKNVTGQKTPERTSLASQVPQVTKTNDELLQVASNKYADGNLPLGDNKYVTDAPKKGYIYLCHAQKDSQGGGAGVDGPWIHGTTWNIKEKVSVSGKNNWPNAQFSNTLSGQNRTLSGNDLPSHPTGTFPIQSSDKAYAYDRNPNSIKTQSFSDQLPANPIVADQPSCIGGEVGITLTGVPLFDGFDAQLRDAAAHEVQDSCQGHPQVSGEYHYHSLSSCINDVNVSTVIGFALDGFPITGPTVAQDKYLTTDDLDECHGMTSEINLDGKKVTMYHYVMTQDFPYSVSCFKGKTTLKQVIQSMGVGQQGGSFGVQGQSGGTTGGSQRTGNSQPPQEALTACEGKQSGATCQFTTPNGSISGTCKTPPNSSQMACVPSQMP